MWLQDIKFYYYWNKNILTSAEYKEKSRYCNYMYLLILCLRNKNRLSLRHITFYCRVGSATLKSPRLAVYMRVLLRVLWPGTDVLLDVSCHTCRRSLILYYCYLTLSIFVSLWFFYVQQNIRIIYLRMTYYMLLVAQRYSTCMALSSTLE